MVIIMNNKKKKQIAPNNQDMISFAGYIFEQVKTQQEARDKWMELYLAIFGGVSAFATIALTFLDDILEVAQMECILGVVFVFTGGLGLLFYLLFLCQRRNYKMHYKVLDEIQKKIIGQYLEKDYEQYYRPDKSPFKKFKKGADFYASLIHNCIVDICFMIGSAFIMAGCKIEKKIIVAGVLGIGIVIQAVLRKIYRDYEKKE